MNPSGSTKINEVKIDSENKEHTYEQSEARTKENKSKMDAMAKVFIPKANLSGVTKLYCIMLSGDNKLGRDMNMEENWQNSYLNLGKDECLLTESSEVVSRQVIRNDGVYIRGNIERVNVTLTADTGASRTVVSTRVYNEIP